VVPELVAPAYRFAVAPRFALASPWSGRFERSSGIVLEDGATRALPRDDWKPLDRGASGALLDEVGAGDAVLPPTHLGLLQLPERLRRAWWSQAARSGGVATSGAGFEKLFSELVDFLRFKRLPLPASVRLEVAVSAPGLRSTRVGSDGALEGLGFGGRGSGAAAGESFPLGLVNLGDEPSFVVLLELPPATLALRLEAGGEAGARALSPRALVAQYFRAFPDQACLRLRLAPGEGLWLSPFGVVHDGWTVGRQDVDVTLRIGQAASASAGG
jgi:hypothetical protein